MFDTALAQRSDVIGTRDLDALVKQRVGDMMNGLSRDIGGNLVVNMLEKSRIDAALYSLIDGLEQALKTTIEYAADATTPTLEVIA